MDSLSHGCCQSFRPLVVYGSSRPGFHIRGPLGEKRRAAPRVAARRRERAAEARVARHGAVELVRRHGDPGEAHFHEAAARVGGDAGAEAREDGAVRRGLEQRARHAREPVMQGRRSVHVVMIGMTILYCTNIAECRGEDLFITFNWS